MAKQSGSAFGWLAVAGAALAAVAVAVAATATGGRRTGMRSGPVDLGKPAVVDVPLPVLTQPPLSPPWPILVRSEFGMRVHPISGEWKMHDGIDLAAQEGMPVLSSSDGIVVAGRGFDAPDDVNGNAVHVRSGPFRYAYLHLQSIASNLAVGASVKAGQVLGLAGETGRATGPHLHFQVYAPVGGSPRTIDPRRVFAPGVLTPVRRVT